MLDFGTLKESHNKYLELKSLNKTAEWLRDVKGIDVTRHDLSKFFHRNDLYVAPPNGRPPAIYYQENKEYESGETELAVKAIDLAWSDVHGYFTGTGSRIDYMSACWFLASETYTLFLEILGDKVSSDTIPKGIKIDLGDILTGRELYERNYRYWVHEQ